MSKKTESIIVEGIRTNCITGEAYKTECTFVTYYYEGLETQCVKIADGGVTGYESLQCEDFFGCCERGNGWYACAGTKGSWDTLQVPLEELLKVKAWLAEQGIEQEAKDDSTSNTD